MFRAPCLSLFTTNSTWLVIFLVTGLSASHAEGPSTPNILAPASFDLASATYVPWAGVDAHGLLHGIDGEQIMVNDAGNIGAGKFGPSVAVADLNGDGKPDIIMADSRGFFWYYPNSGTPTAPAFTQGEVMPIWLGEERLKEHDEAYDNIVPRFQMIDATSSGKLDVVAGTFAGKLFRIPNVGSPTVPVFRPTKDHDGLLINTRRRGLLWCTYLAPFLTTAFNSSNTLDLLVGEGSYSANSIYLLHNTASGGSFTFDEDHTAKIIPGMGLEQLTPCPVDWNNDGKVDVLTGDRTGDIMLYLNNSTDPGHPTFAPATPVTFGGTQKLGGATTVTVCDLTGNHLPNLLIGRDDGTLLYATNTGKLGSPQFGAPVPVKGVLPPEYHYMTPYQWQKRGAYGMPYEMIGCVNPQLESGFAFPEGVKSKYALKFWVWPYKSVYFPQRYAQPMENEVNEHQLYCNYHIMLKVNTRYRLHFWLKANGMTNLRYKLQPDDRWANSPDFSGPLIEKPINAGSSWTEFTESIRIDNPDVPTILNWGYRFSFQFDGQGTLYASDLSMQENQ